MLKTNLQHEEKEKEKGGRREDMREREKEEGGKEGAQNKFFNMREDRRERESVRKRE